jgi:hypothetical protein
MPQPAQLKRAGLDRQNDYCPRRPLRQMAGSPGHGPHFAALPLPIRSGRARITFRSGPSDVPPPHKVPISRSTARLPCRQPGTLDIPIRHYVCSAGIRLPLPGAFLHHSEGLEFGLDTVLHGIATRIDLPLMASEQSPFRSEAIDLCVEQQERLALCRILRNSFASTRSVGGAHHAGSLICWKGHLSRRPRS